MSKNFLIAAKKLIPSPSIQKSKIIIPFLKLNEASKILQSGMIPFSEDVPTHGSSIKKIGKILTTSRIHYCVIPIIIPKSGQYYGLHHYEGDNDLQNLDNLIKKLRFLNSNSQHSAIIYVNAIAPDIWNPTYEKQDLNRHNVSKILDENKISNFVKCGNNSKIFTCGNDVYNFNIQDIYKKLELINSKQQIQK
jgi:hypothetical protein